MNDREEELLKKLRDKDPKIREDAKYLLSRVKLDWSKNPAAKKEILELIEILINKNEDWNIKKIALEVLGSIGGSDFIESIISALTDKSWHVQMKAAEVLGTIKDLRSVEPLISALKSEYPAIRVTAADALGKIRDKKAIKPLIAVLNDEYSYVREKAIWSLGEMKYEIDEMDLLMTQLKCENQDIRIEAVEALGKLNNTIATEPLINMLKDKHPDVRKRALETLDKIVPNWIESEIVKIYFPVFVKVLDNEDSEIKVFMTEILMKIQDARAIKPLISTLKDMYKPLQKKVEDVVKKIVNANIHFLEGYPCLFCTDCFLRSMKETAKISIFKSYDYVVCRCCGSSLRLIKNVKEVVGLIGGDDHNCQLNGESFYVNLWNEVEKKARNADIDILVIQETTGISYDYAVNAVLNVLKNDVSRPGKYVKGIPVIIRGNPLLSENSKMILEHEFGGIR